MTRKLAPIFVLSLLLCASALAAEVDLPLVEARLSAVAQLAPGEQQTALLAAYGKVQQALLANADFERLTRVYAQDTIDAPQRERVIRARMEKVRESSPEQINQAFSNYSHEQLDALLAKMWVDLSANIAALGALDSQLAVQESNSKQRQQRLTDITAQLRALPPVAGDVQADGAPREAEAAQWLDTAQRQALRSEEAALIGATSSQPARYALLRAQRAELDNEVKRSQLARAVVESLLEQARARQSDKARLKLESLATDSPVIAKLAATNLALIDQQSNLSSVSAAIANCSNQTKLQLSRLQELYASAKRRVEFARDSVELGHVLIAQLEKSRSNPINKSSCKLSQLPADIIIARIGLEEELQRLDNSTRYIDQLLESAGQTEALSRADRQHAEELARGKQNLLIELIATQTSYVSAIASLRSQEQELAQDLADYHEFLSAYLMWVRSQSTLSPQSLTSLGAEFATVKKSLRSIDVASAPLNWREVLLLLGATVLLLLRQILQRWKSTLLGRSQRPRSDSITLSVRALLAELLLCLPLFLATLACVAWLSRMGGGAANLGQTLLFLACCVFTLLTVRAICSSDGIGRRLFYWSEAACEFGRGEARWVLNWWLPPIAIAAALYMLTAASGRTELVRLLELFAVVMLLARWMPRHRLHTLTGKPQAQSRLILMRFLLLSSTLLAVIGLVLGYVHTTVVIGARLLATLWLLWGLILVNAVLVRWLLILRRQVRFRELLEARAASSEDEPASDEDRVELSEISEASRRLLHFVVIVTGLVLVWLVWQPLLPVLNILSEVVVWTSTVVDGDVTVTKMVTLPDLLTIVVYAVGFIVAARTLPDLLELVLLQQSVSAGARYTLTTLASYLIIGTGILTVVSMLGVSWGKLQWLVAALGVGIGFGLQEIVANFISGIILLFERPIRVGDTITVGETDGQVTKIQIRATTLRDWNGKELVVPNKEFITGRLLNWTLSDTKIRLTITVGIAYGSDLDAAMVLLEDIVRAHPTVLTEPEPTFIMSEFGDNALIITARYFISGIDQWWISKSDLHLIIYRRFTAAGIAIAFPQRDVHFHSKDPIRIKLEAPEQEKQPPAADD